MMQALLDAIAELVTLVSPKKIQAIASRVLGTTAVRETGGLNALVSTPTARAALGRVLDAWSNSNLSGDALAGMLMGALHVRQRVAHEQMIELVWTGPTTPFVPTRRTAQVLLDVIRSAKHDLFLVSFVAYDVPSIVKALNDASQRGVEIRLLLESSASHGGSLSVDPIAAMRTCVPLAELYVWRDKIEPFTDGRVHAKVAVADGRVAFITSANLTGHALEKNMEVGVSIIGGLLPSTLRSHLQALLDTGIVNKA